MDPRPSAGRAEPSSRKPDVPWFHRLSRPTLFLIVTLVLVGGYLAVSIPVAVFPNTDFPRILIGVENGGIPNDQKLVPITRPPQETVNKVPSLPKLHPLHPPRSPA